MVARGDLGACRSVHAALHTTVLLPIAPVQWEPCIQQSSGIRNDHFRDYSILVQVSKVLIIPCIWLCDCAHIPPDKSLQATVIGN